MSGRAALAKMANAETVLVIGRPHRVLEITMNLRRVAGLTIYTCSVDGDRLDLMTKIPNTCIVYASADQCVAAVRTAARSGAPSVIIEAAGFGESSRRGRDLEHELIEVARAEGLRLLGPNSLGVYNGRRNLTMGPFPMPDLTPGAASLIVQSGVMAGGLLAEVMKLGQFQLGKMISLGGRADLDEVDSLNYLADDPETTAVGCYFEHVSASTRFVNAVTRVRARKPIVCMLGGRTLQGSAAASRHTARRGAPIEKVRDILEELRVPIVERLRDLLEVTGAVSKSEWPRLAGRPHVGIITLTGSGAVSLVDSMTEWDIPLARLSAGTIRELKKVLPRWLPVDNPVDLWPSLERGKGVSAFRTSLTSMVSDPGVDVIVCIVPVWGETRALDDFRTAMSEVRSHKPVLMWSPGAESGLLESFSGLITVPSLESVAPALRSLEG